MSDFRWDQNRGDFPNLSDMEVEFLVLALGVTADGASPRLKESARSLFLKASHCAAQRKIPPYGG